MPPKKRKTRSNKDSIFETVETEDQSVTNHGVGDDGAEPLPPRKRTKVLDYVSVVLIALLFIL
jgi:hypothetical protein